MNIFIYVLHMMVYFSQQMFPVSVPTCVKNVVCVYVFFYTPPPPQNYHAGRSQRGVKFVARVSGWMLILAALQTTDALYTNESIRFNNRSPIWHRGPSSTLYPGKGSHSCFQTAVHCEPPGPRIKCCGPIWPPHSQRKTFLTDIYPRLIFCRTLDCVRSS